MSSIVSMPAPWSNRKRLVQALLLELGACPGLPVHALETAEIRIIDAVLEQVQVCEREQAKAGELDIVQIDATPPFRPVARNLAVDGRVPPSAAAPAPAWAASRSQRRSTSADPAPLSRSGCSPSVSRRSRTVFVRWMRRFSKTSGSIEKPRPSSVARAYQSMNSPAGNRDEKPPCAIERGLADEQGARQAPGCGSSGHWTRARSSSVRSELTNCSAWQSTPSRSPVASSAATWSPSLSEPRGRRRRGTRSRRPSPPARRRYAQGRRRPAPAGCRRSERVRERRRCRPSSRRRRR